MNSIIEKNLMGITAASVEKYLLFTGWERDLDFVNHRLRVFYYKEDPEFRLAIPSNDSSKEFLSKLYDIIITLSDFQEKSHEEIIEAMKSAYVDRIQFRIISEITKGGKLPLSYATKCIEGLRELVLYAACAEESARPICMRAFSQAQTSLDRFQFAQTGYGSFVFNIDVCVVDEENEQDYLHDVIEQLPDSDEHKIVKRIKTAIEQIDGAVKRTSQIRDLVATGYQDGVTANICDALGKLRPEGATDIQVETTFHFAEAITQTVEKPSRTTLENIHFMVADELSKRFKDRNLIEDVVLTGTIKMLTKESNPDSNEVENTIKLVTKIDGQTRSISVHLPAADHIAACDAYRDDREVEISGTLDKSQSRWFFTDVANFRVL